MRNVIPYLALAALAMLFTAGCTGPETKLGRGLNNVNEAARLGEMRRSIEQTAIFDSPDTGYTYGFVHGVSRSVGRVGLGLFEVVTFPFPPYHPVATKYFPPDAVYPANFTPGLMADSMFDTDTYFGFSGGAVLPMVPGNRFSVFDNN